MGYNVILSTLALEDLEQIVAYVAQNDPAAAERLGHRLLDQAIWPVISFQHFFRKELRDGMVQALFLRPEAWKHATGNKQVTKGKEIIMDKGNNYRPNGCFSKHFELRPQLWQHAVWET